VLEFQQKLRGCPLKEGLIVVDGKEPKQGTGNAVSSAMDATAWKLKHG
jgi:hypothetical protein